MLFAAARTTGCLDAQDTGQKTVAVTKISSNHFSLQDVHDILMGFFCARTNMKIHTAFTFFVNTLALRIVPTYSAFAMCLHGIHYINEQYN